VEGLLRFPPDRNRPREFSPGEEIRGTKAVSPDRWGGCPAIQSLL